MDDNNDLDKNIGDLMLPGFRFHPTDEELVGFYLKRKLEHRSLPIELIKQVDIYKYDPWDLPKLVTTGEKECYFYCPRDRKYRNSLRPNRVTGSGFWKATGTDRPIYSSDGTRCIGLKKSLVFYRGRAARGIKTDWMMHEFRLPSSPDTASSPLKKILDKNLPANDSWAICRIFKKINSVAHRALSQSWATSLPETNNTSQDLFTQTNTTHQTHFSSDNLSSPSSENRLQHAAFPLYKPIPTIKQSNDYFPIFSPPQHVSSSSAFINCVDYSGTPLLGSLQVIQESIDLEDEQGDLKRSFSPKNAHNPWADDIRTMGFPFSFPSPATWDSPPCCPSEMSSSTAYCEDKC